MSPAGVTASGSAVHTIASDRRPSDDAIRLLESLLFLGPIWTRAKIGEIAGLRECEERCLVSCLPTGDKTEIRITDLGRSTIRPVFCVTDFGALGDGKHNDWMAFYAAATAASKVKGSTVYVPEGMYKLIPVDPNTSVAFKPVCIKMSHPDCLVSAMTSMACWTRRHPDGKRCIACAPNGCEL